MIFINIQLITIGSSNIGSNNQVFVQYLQWGSSGHVQAVGYWYQSLSSSVFFLVVKSLGKKIRWSLDSVRFFSSKLAWGFDSLIFFLIISLFNLRNGLVHNSFISLSFIHHSQISCGWWWSGWHLHHGIWGYTCSTRCWRWWRDNWPSRRNSGQCVRRSGLARGSSTLAGFSFASLWGLNLIRVNNGF